METIKLSDFITDTLTEIASGIKNANQKMGKESTAFQLLSPQHSTEGKSIEFDISITATKDESGKGGFSIGILNVGVGAKLEEKTGNQFFHRIKFEIATDSHLR